MSAGSAAALKTVADAGESAPSVYQAVAAVMGEVQAIGKDRQTEAGNRYRFRGIEAVVNAVGPALRKHGVIVAPVEVSTYDYVTVEVGSNRSRMASIRTKVKYRWYGPGGDSFDTEAVAEAFDSGDKATAKAMSVAFRTMLTQTLCIPTDDPDPDDSQYERSAAIVTDPEWLESARKRLSEAMGLPALEAIKAEVTRRYSEHKVSEDDYLALGNVYAKALDGLNATAAAHAEPEPPL